MSGGAQSIGGLFQGISGFMQGNIGASIARDTANLTAQMYLNSAAVAEGTGEFNASVISLNEQRAHEDLYKNLYRINSSATAAAGKSGVNVSSGSFLSVYNASLTAAELQDHRIGQTAEIARRKAEFEAQAQAVALRNQAAIARYQGEVAAFQSESAGMNALFSGIGSLF